MIDEKLINKDIVKVTNIILEVESLGYIPNTKKYLKLNKILFVRN